MTTIRARYHGRCDACGEEYPPGTIIHRDETDEWWVHATCPDDGHDATGPACPACWLIGPCDCEATK